jgi:hypothetical protein
MMISHACALSFSPLANHEDLGVLFSPLIPPRRKEAMHKKNQKILAPRSPLKVELPLSLFWSGYPNSHKKNHSNKIWHHNFTHTIHDPFLLVAISFIEFFLVSTCQFHIKLFFFKLIRNYSPHTLLTPSLSCTKNSLFNLIKCQFLSPILKSLLKSILVVPVFPLFPF